MRPKHAKSAEGWQRHLWLKVALMNDESMLVKDSRICILMAVYNGAKELPEQLASFASQTYSPTRIIASDDGSIDGSRTLLQSWNELPCQVVDGPGQGYAANFLSLIMRAPEGMALAFSDQDDVWRNDKLARAVAKLSEVPKGKPALYCSRRTIWLPEKDRKFPSRRYFDPPSFENSLVENIAAGNTIVLNREAADLARSACANAVGIYAHDWWLYQIISGSGGCVMYDSTSTLLYRQHENNAIGSGERIRSKIANKIGVIKGEYSNRISAQIQALNRSSDILTPKNRKTVETFMDAREARFPMRLYLMSKTGVRRQGCLSNIGFWGAFSCGWL